MVDYDARYSSPTDLAFSLIAPSLPINLAINAFTAPEKLSMLPIARNLQHLSGLTTAQMPIDREKQSGNPMANTLKNFVMDPGGLNMDMNPGLGLPPADMRDYRINLMLSNMVGDGDLDWQTAVEAMISKKGVYYEKAAQRAAAQAAIKYFGSPMGVDFYPSGEEKMRGLQVKYSEAIDAKKRGDTTATQRFWDDNQQYSARQSAMLSGDPEELLKRYLWNTVQNRYYEASSAQQQEIKKGFGANFVHTFGLDGNDSRSYDSASIDQLANWSKSLKGFAPEPYEATTPVQWIPAETQTKLDAWKKQKDRMGNIGILVSAYYSNSEDKQAEMVKEYPQIKTYLYQRNKLLGDNPDMIPYLTSEDNSLADLPVEQQAQVYKFRALKEEKYPDLYDKWDEYYRMPSTNSLDKTARSRYFEKYLEPSIEFERKYASENPRAAAYIMGDSDLAANIIGNQDAVQRFREVKNQMFPGIDNTLMVYNKIEFGGAEMRSFEAEHPEILMYKSLTDAIAAARPEMAAEIKSSGSLRYDIMRDYDQKQFVNKVVTELTPETSMQVMSYVLTGEDLSKASKDELRRVLSENGWDESYDGFMDLFDNTMLNEEKLNNFQ
jgi:hypothetical protein